MRTARHIITEHSWRTRLSLLSGLLLLCSIGLYWKHISIESSELKQQIAALVLLLGLWLVLHICPRFGLFSNPEANALANRGRRFLLISIYFPVLSAAFCVLSYLAISLHFPCIDQELAAADRLIGFDWKAYYDWVTKNNNLALIMLFAYKSIAWQQFPVILVSGFFSPVERLNEFIGLVIVSSLIVIVMVSLFPAQGAFFYYHQSNALGRIWVSDFLSIWNGRMPVIDLSRLQGLVTMPSFHTCIAIFYIYALRDHRWLMWPALILNCLMILATPVYGGHYLLDVLAGLLLSIGLIVLSSPAKIRFGTEQGRINCT
jgi:membrane-associated phospholipid phosphatase